MNLVLKKYLVRLVLFTVIVGLIAFLAAYYLPEKFVTPALPFIIIFFFAIAALTYFFAIKAFSKKTTRYANFFMISVFAKLLLYVVVILVYAFINAGDIVSFILTFFIIYFLFTTFETFEIFKAQRLKR